MQRLSLIKNLQQEIQLITNRVIISSLIIACCMTLLLVRLAYLQIYKHNLYTTLSTKNCLDLVPIEPTRGLIYDRNNVLLAQNIPVFSLDIIPMQVVNLSKTLTNLNKIITLSENDISQFNKQLKQHRRFDEIPLKLRLTEEEVSRFAENQYRFPGVAIKARLIRYYPYGKSFSHVVGYMGRINSQELQEIDTTNYSASYYIGKLGIEKYYEEELHGKVGYQEVENDANGKAVRILKEIKSIPGKNIYLTLDIGLQLAAEKALSHQQGAVVAIQPSSGQVLAMVSQPGYDPNQFMLGISQTDYRAMQQSQDHPLYNRALRGLYPLASTIKPYLALAGLDAGMITPIDTIYDPGWFQLRNNTHKFHDWVRYGHGMVDLNKAIVSSCDIYFYHLANKMGIHRIDTILNQFGFGNLTGIDLDEEISGIVASPEWKQRVKGERWFDGDTINSAIGQGYMRTTPLQLALATSILANRGQRFIPYLLLGEHMPGKTYLPQHPILLDKITLHHEKFWDTIILAMQNVIISPHGTAYRYGRKHHYTLAAKTGTAQVIARRGNRDEVDKQVNLQEKLRDHHLFIAFAPVDKPKIALSVITENSNTAIETARDILDYYLSGDEHHAH
ncbi:MAG TPA: penicillin-binding protein 2 [Gammaproteobacteria bacterium]|nr:penicillin-binding protein 2 [Gammaproteobacteria bacterium]